MLHSPESGTLAVTIIPVSPAGAAAVPGLSSPWVHLAARLEPQATELVLVPAIYIIKQQCGATGGGAQRGWLGGRALFLL